MNVILIGGFVEIIELCELCNYNILGIIDNILELGKKYAGYPVIGRDTDAQDLVKTYQKIPLIISPDSPLKRKQLEEFYTSLGFTFTSLISPKAEISKSAKIGNGVVIQSGANISSNVTLGNYTKINTRANIMHDGWLGEFTTIAPNAVLLGGVIIKDCCYIGANATIMPHVIIHEQSMVGAGSVVVREVMKNKIVKGVPAR
jgi:sugar O-acyltransferase (sialic acid O-acetyltransferase NeuD family)